jgi:hypothetical protein
MSRRTRGCLLIAAGIVAILAGILFPPAPWVIIWAPGVLLVVIGYSHATDRRPERDARPGYINDPWKDKRP